MIIPFEREYRDKYFQLLQEVFESNFLSEGEMVHRFEQAFSSWIGDRTHCLAVNSGGAGLWSLLEAAGVRGGEVIVPSNTFMATPRAVELAGGKVVFADCNRNDLCLSFSDMKDRITPQTKAVVVVHIGGHLAFDIEKIADYLYKRNIPLIEDCAHAHGAEYKGKKAGTYGLGGAYSFYATKTMPLGEGGMVVSVRSDVADFVRTWRNYGKFEYTIPGFNARMNEVTAALGLVQLERMPRILAWKRALALKYDRIFQHKVILPDQMASGFYKYIVFDTELREETGKVFDHPCHEIMKHTESLPHTQWIKQHHACPPMYYGWDGAELSIDELAARLLVEGR